MAWKVTYYALTPDVSVSQYFLIFSSRPESNTCPETAQPVSLRVSISFQAGERVFRKSGLIRRGAFCTREHVTSCLTADSPCKVKETETIEDSIQHPRVFWFFLDVAEQ
jgi:hypothetical protein